MKPEEINQAIAEHQGWVWYRIPNTSFCDRIYRCLFLAEIHEPNQSPDWLVRADGTERVCNWEYMKREGLVLDYYNDLNAVHQAELSLTDGQAMEFERVLLRVITKRSYRHVISAKANERAEAFLRTIVKWVES